MAKLTEQEQIAPDESAAAKPEIEPGENPDDKPGKERDESTVAKGDAAAAVCPVEMSYPAQRCRRKLHVAPEGADDKPVCLMHSKDPNKQSGGLFDAFWLEFVGILEKAVEGEAHFERFVFPLADFSKREFRAICRFEGAIFTQNAHFNEATFTQNAYFGEAKFKRVAVFWKATFTGNANFSGAIFRRNAVFREVIFKQNVELGRAIFKQNADFREATFNFNEATLEQRASFYKAIFTHDADFREATFKHDAWFSEAIFTQNASFELTEFSGTADWQGSRFLDQAEFRSTKFDPQVEGAPSAVFALAKFSKPSEIVFDDVDLSRALFHNCDVSQVCFTSSVRWAKREGNRGLAVFEETIDLEQYARGSKRDGERDFRAVAQIYQQLKKNYDSRLDYWTANEFHFGEMEMMRLAGLARCLQLKGKWMLRHHIQQQFTRLRQWCHPRLSFVALSLYKYASDYGNSYGKPLAWLLGVLLAWALLFPLPGLGLERGRPDWVETYGSVWRASSSWRQGVWWEFVLIMKSWVMAVDVAMFQKNANYTPATDGAHAVAIVETLLISTLFGLFLLAVRRQFKR
jgi:uncharacterized protein YjbI with pentapeptide repeats